MKIVTTLVALRFLLGVAHAQTYGTFEKPFNATSIWNTTIASGAQYAPAGTSTANQNLFNPGRIGIHRTNSGDPLRNVYSKSLWATCGGGVDTSKLVFRVNLPDSFLIRKTEDNGVYAWVDSTGAIWEGMMFERCTIGSDAAIYGWSSYDPVPGSPYYISGNGLPKLGMSAAGLSGVGGVIRQRELTSGTLNHALKITLSSTLVYYNASDPTRGYRWPAVSADGSASYSYVGTNPNVELGSLIALNPSYNCDALATEPGRRICRAFKTYGAYVSDTCCNTPSGSPAWWIIFETNTDVDFSVHNEIMQAYNINLQEMWFRYTTPQTVSFKSDLDKMYNSLQVVTNTSSQYPKGPGSVMAPPQPPTALMVK